MGPAQQRRGIAWRELALAALVVFVGGLLAGWLFAKGSPQAAAGALVADFVEDEPFLGNEDRPSQTDELAPTSGDHRGVVRCGVVPGPLSADDQLASLAAGIVLIQYDSAEVPESAVGDLVVFAMDRDELLVGSQPGLESPVVATSWGRRMRLTGVNEELLASFHTAFRGGGPDASGCP